MRLQGTLLEPLTLRFRFSRKKCRVNWGKWDKGVSGTLTTFLAFSGTQFANMSNVPLTIK